MPGVLLIQFDIMSMVFVSTVSESRVSAYPRHGLSTVYLRNIMISMKYNAGEI